MLPVGLAGGLTGALLLLVTPSDVFEGLAPVLVLLACGLFALQPVLARRLQERSPARRPVRPVPALALVCTFLGAIYGGYFGAGLGVVLLAVLGLALDDELVRINGLRGVLSLIVNSIAVVVFVVAADVAWHDAGVLTVTSLIGGYAGARLSRRLPVPVFRTVVIGLGLVAAAWMLLGWASLGSATWTSRRIGTGIQAFGRVTTSPAASEPPTSCATGWGHGGSCSARCCSSSAG